MILYELDTEIEPLEAHALPDIKKIIVDKNLRPQIPADGSTDPNLASLIRQCWDRRPENRPNIGQVIEALEKVEF